MASLTLPSIVLESKSFSVIEPAMEVAGRTPEMASSTLLSVVLEPKNTSIIEPTMEVAGRAPEMAMLDVGKELTATLSAVPDRAPSADCERKKFHMSARVRCRSYLVRL